MKKNVPDRLRSRRRPRLILAGLSGGSGKTIVSLGLCRAWERAGLDVRPFKKGPDYIDAAWLGLAAGRPAANLDPFLMPKERTLPLFLEKSNASGVAVIEGNRGLFDGKDVHGSCSTAELARRLAAPVILIVDATKMTRTAAAVVKGCAEFEENLRLAGVVFNRTAGERHRSILKQAVEAYTDVPVLGMLPKMRNNPIPERHMGLISNREHAGRDDALDSLAAFIESGLETDRLLEIANAAPPLETPTQPLWDETSPPAGPKPRIGVVRDAALWFYYPENIEALERAGAEIVTLSLLSDDPWPEIHGLYLGGGFPETHAERLAKNTPVRNRVKRLSRMGLPVYAECGGFMYLCQSLRLGDAEHPMAGVFDFATTLRPRPQGLGYSRAVVTADNPFHPLGTELVGHEFHYSRCLAGFDASGEPSSLPDADAFALAMRRGRGMLHNCDGLVQNNTFAAYTHIHALGAPHWAPCFVEAARLWKKTAPPAA